MDSVLNRGRTDLFSAPIGAIWCFRTGLILADNAADLVTLADNDQLFFGMNMGRIATATPGGKYASTDDTVQKQLMNDSQQHNKDVLTSWGVDAKLIRDAYRQSKNSTAEKRAEARAQLAAQMAAPVKAAPVKATPAPVKVIEVNPVNKAEVMKSEFMGMSAEKLTELAGYGSPGAVTELARRDEERKARAAAKAAAEAAAKAAAEAAATPAPMVKAAATPLVKATPAPLVPEVIDGGTIAATVEDLSVLSRFGFLRDGYGRQILIG